MTEAYKKALRDVVIREGSKFTNDPVDPGGATKYGVTQTVYDAWRTAKRLVKRSVAHIEEWEVEQIYYERYWIPSKAAYLRAPLNEVVFDTAVNFGVARALQFLIISLGLPKSVRWDAEASTRVHSRDPKLTALGILGLRMEYRGRRVLANSSQVKFLKGWLNRDRAMFDAVIE